METPEVAVLEALREVAERLREAQEALAEQLHGDVSTPPWLASGYRHLVETSRLLRCRAPCSPVRYMLISPARDLAKERSR